MRRYRWKDGEGAVERETEKCGKRMIEKRKSKEQERMKEIEGEEMK